MSNELCRSATEPAIDARFDEVVLPHLDAAKRLARWLMRNEHDAEDVVQEASLRAFRYFRTFAGGNGRAWFLRIVRNICHGWRGSRKRAPADPFDEERHSRDRRARDPEALVLLTEDVRLLERALGDVPDRLRELLVLRELEGQSYAELAASLDMPIGSVMSGLWRARKAFQSALNNRLKESGHSRKDTLVNARQARHRLEPPGPGEEHGN